MGFVQIASQCTTRPGPQNACRAKTQYCVEHEVSVVATRNAISNLSTTGLFLLP